MNVIKSLLCLILALISLGAAQAGNPPIASTEQIGPVLVSPNSPLQLFFPNVADPKHPKDLIFRGTFANTSTFSPAFGKFWFDWYNPSTGGFDISPAVPINLHPGETLAVGIPGANLPPITFQIPFCPPEVSVHFEVDSDPIASNGVEVRGLFTHICRVPEPSSVLLAGLGLAGVGVVALRRRRS